MGREKNELDSVRTPVVEHDAFAPHVYRLTLGHLFRLPDPRS